MRYHPPVNPAVASADMQESSGRSPRGPARTAAKPRRGDELELTIERVDARGRPCGRARHATGEYAVALRRGVIGARVRVRVTRRRGERVEGHPVDVLEPGPHAVAPRCGHFGTCGGCSFQDVAYPAQLAIKHAIVEQALAARGLQLAVDPCAAAVPWGYRNKMEFTFGRRWVDAGEPEHAPADFALGLHPLGQHRKVFDLLECPIQSDAMTAVVQTARRLAVERGLEAWDLRAHAGLLRHLVLRRSSASGELMAVLVTSTEDPGRIRPYAAELLAAHPEITTLVQAINARHGQTALGERELVLHGPGWITERLGGLAGSPGGLELRLSARSFFQTNSRAAETLLAVVREEAACGPSDAVLDLFCGTGLFALALARGARAVEGWELAPEAVADARANAQRNGIENARFTAGDVARLLAAAGSEPGPDVVVVDPPRAGLHPSVPPALAALRPRRLVYVSCNPRAAAADLAFLAGAGLELQRARPIDLFPHTPHVECVFTLERRSACQSV
jgi:23S rRNA (uracil1939-C5)-methyltransferase